MDIDSSRAIGDHGMLLTTPPARDRHVRDALADPNRVAAAREAHTTALRRLATAAQCAADAGATWDEIRTAVEAAVAGIVKEGQSSAVFAASARARVHDGDDSF